MSPKSERVTTGTPNTNGPDAIVPKDVIITNPEANTKLTPIIDNTKCVLRNVKMPLIKPNVKAKTLKMPITKREELDP